MIRGTAFSRKKNIICQTGTKCDIFINCYYNRSILFVHMYVLLKCAGGSCDRDRAGVAAPTSTTHIPPLISQNIESIFVVCKPKLFNISNMSSVLKIAVINSIINKIFLWKILPYRIRYKMLSYPLSQLLCLIVFFYIKIIHTLSAHCYFTYFFSKTFIRTYK